MKHIPAKSQRYMINATITNDFTWPKKGETSSNWHKKDALQTILLFHNTTAILTHQITIEMITKFMPQITMELILESGHPFQQEFGSVHQISSETRKNITLGK